MRQYPEIKFREEDRRTYAYHWDGEPLRVGDMVDVEGRGGKPASVKIHFIGMEQPPFATKPIIGKSKPADGMLI